MLALKNTTYWVLMPKYCPIRPLDLTARWNTEASRARQAGLRPGISPTRQIGKLDSLSRCVNPMTRFVPNGRNFSGKQQGQLIGIQGRILLLPRHDSPSSVTSAEHSDKRLEGPYMLKLELPNDIQTRLELLSQHRHIDPLFCP